MKKFIFVFLLLLSISSYGQYHNLRQNDKLIGGGFGTTWIDGEPHYSFRLFPEFSFGDFGVGLNLRLEYDSGGKLRSENFNTTSDYLSIIRYFRYGLKGDPFYARLGELDYATLGHGSIMYLYNNSPSFDDRQIGLELDVDFHNFGFESVYSSFGEKGIMGVRFYVRPFQFTNMIDIPIISMMEVGATVTADMHDKAGVIDGSYNAVENSFTSSIDDEMMVVYGFDLGFPILRNRLLDLDLYYDYAKIDNFGHGTSAGAMFHFKGFSLVDMNVKFERRWNGDEYIPSYFNAFYEIERFKLNKETGTISSKAKMLYGRESVGNGYYGELFIKVLGTFDVLGSYQRLDDDPESGILHLSTDISPDGMPYVARAGYDKINIKDESDLFTLDDRSYLFAEFGYKPLPYLVVSMVYHWTFTPVRDADENVIDYKPQKKIEPRISFYYPLQ